MGNCCLGISKRNRRSHQFNSPTRSNNQITSNNEAEYGGAIWNEATTITHQDNSPELLLTQIEQDDLPVSNISNDDAGSVNEMYSLRSLCSEVIINSHSIEKGLSNLTLPNLLKENLAIYIQEKKKIDKAMISIIIEIEIMDSQMRPLNEVLEILGWPNEHFEFVGILADFRDRTHDITRRVMQVAKDYRTIRINGIPCLYDGSNFVLSITKRCQSILRSIHQLEKDMLLMKLIP